MQGDAVLLRAFIGDDDTFEDGPLSEAILAEARRRGVAGATVARTCRLRRVGRAPQRERDILPGSADCYRNYRL